MNQAEAGSSQRFRPGKEVLILFKEKGKVLLKLWTGEQQGILEWPASVEKRPGFVAVVKTTLEIEMMVERP